MKYFVNSTSIVILLFFYSGATAAESMKKATLKLMCASQRDDINLAIQSIADGASVNSALDGTSAFGEAIRSNSSKVVKLLINGGADVNQADKHGTPLCSALVYGRGDFLKLLLEGEVDPNSDLMKPNCPRRKALIELLDPTHLSFIKSPKQRQAKQRWLASLLLKHGAEIETVFRALTTKLHPRKAAVCALFGPDVFTVVRLQSYRAQSAATETTVSGGDEIASPFQQAFALYEQSINNKE